LAAAISVSSPGEAELKARGLLSEHIDHAFVEIARQVLAGGGCLAYGGDLRVGGFTRTLEALLRTYSAAARPDAARIRQYLARPVWSKATIAELADTANVFSVVKVEGWEGEGEAEVLRARDFTLMRERMTRETDARIVIGGNPVAGAGRWPGVVEEAALAAQASQPLFVCGGLGGGGSLVAQALRGEWPAELTGGYQAERSPNASTLAQVGLPLGEEELREVLLDAEPHNELSEADNELLMETTDLDTIIALILRGLNALNAITV
jgi:hypothetical protein